MGLTDDLERIAALATAHGDLSAVLAAEPTSGLRVYLVAYGEGDDRRWALLDDAGRLVETRDDVRAAASIIAMSELTAELAGAEDEPRLATPAYLDHVGVTVADGLRGSTGVVEAFVDDVLRGYLVGLG